MTTPAISLDQTNWVTRTFEFQKQGSPAYNKQYTTVSSSVRQNRPTSGTSPKRSDDSRPPRAWNHNWARTSAPERTVEFSQIDSAGWKWTYRGTADMMPLKATQLVGQVAPWSGMGSYGFPYNVEAMARTKFLNKLSESKASLGATLGELRQTYNYLGKASEDILDAISGISRAVKRSRKMVVDELLGRKVRRPRGNRTFQQRWDRGNSEIRNRWLETQFALKPLYGDIQDLGQALSDAIHVDRRAARFSVRAGASEVTLMNATGLTCGFAPAPQFSVPCMVETSCHISAVYDVPISDARTLQQLGLGNPAAVAWELLAFSWMVDYLVGMGQWLDSMTADRGTRFIEGSLSRLQRASAVAPAVFSPAYPRTTLVSGFSPLRVQLEGGRFSREVLTTAVFPSVVPPVRNILNLTRAANSLAALSKLR